VLVGLLTGGTRGRAGEARKRLQVAGALGRCLGRPGRCGARGGAVGGLHHVEHETQPHQADEQQLVEKRVWHHGIAPLTHMVKWGYLERVAELIFNKFNGLYGTKIELVKHRYKENTRRTRTECYPGVLGCR